MDLQSGLPVGAVVYGHRHHQQRTAAAFPQNWSKLQSARLDVRYQWTKALQVHLHYTREQFGSGDWALQGVGVASVPNLLSLGLQPYRDHVDLLGLTLRYDIEPGNAAPRR